MQENTIFVRKYHTDDKRLQIREREIWRYAGYSNVANGVEEELQKILKQVITESQHKFTYHVCYRRMKIKENNSQFQIDKIVNCGNEKILNQPYNTLSETQELAFLSKSKDLAKCLNGSEEIILFAATIGLEADRYIAKYQRFSPVKALLMQAYGAERIECLCDVFCKEIKEEVQKEGLFCTARFSPGYGDLSLDAQKEFFGLLDCQRQIGLTLNDSLLMTPSKSVTAIFGLGTCVQHRKEEKCKSCKKSDCIYKRL